MKTAAILLAGGTGNRFKSTVPKQFIPLNDKPLALYSFEVLANHPAIHEIIVVAALPYRHFFKGAKFALPGDRRQDSVYNGLCEVSKECEVVCIHDSARPFITLSLIDAILEETKQHGAACAAVPMKSTIKQSLENDFVFQTLDRSTLWEIQTPQCIVKDILLEGYHQAHVHSLTVTDDVSLVELQNKKVKLVNSFYENIKVTTPEDFFVAERLISS